MCCLSHQVCADLLVGKKPDLPFLKNKNTAFLTVDIFQPPRVLPEVFTELLKGPGAQPAEWRPVRGCGRRVAWPCAPSFRPRGWSESQVKGLRWPHLPGRQLWAQV